MFGAGWWKRLMGGGRPDPGHSGELGELLDELELLSDQRLEESVRSAAALSLRKLCDWCVVTLDDPAASERPRIVAHPNAETGQILERALGRDPLELNRRHLHAVAMEALSTGMPVLSEPAADWTLRFYGSNPTERYVLERVTPRFVAAEPLVSRGAVLGVITYANLGSGFADDVRRYQIAFARRLAGLVDRGRRLEELERAREELRTSRKQVYSILDPDFGAVATAGPAWELTYINPAAEELLRLDRERDRGRSIHDALPEKAVGSPLWDIWVAALTQGRSGDARFLESWSGGRRWVEARAHPLAGGGAALYVRDVTHEKEREKRLQQHEQDMLEAQKLETIGRLTGGVAHDFNNILMAINGHAELALRKLPGEHPSRVSLEEVRSSADRGARLIRQLLAYSRKGKQQRRPVDLPDVVANLEASILRLLGEDVELSVRSQWEVPLVLADPNQVEQVIINLAVNARDAMPEGGLLQFDIERRRRLDSDAEAPEETPADGWVVFSVSDEGVGIAPEVLPHVFEPFFTTKSDRTGTGLGLSTVQGIVRQHGGTIAVESTVGKGTTIRVFLPACARSEALPFRRPAAPERPALPPIQPEPQRPAVAAVDREGTILVVEDEERVLAFVSSALRDQGYEVLEARNGVDALAVLKRHDGGIRLLITDVVMPYMGGRELGVRMAEMDPELQVIYMSGYEENQISQNGDVPPGVILIEKPFSSADLLEMVEHVLAGNRRALPCVA